MQTWGPHVDTDAVADGEVESYADAGAGTNADAEREQEQEEDGEKRGHEELEICNHFVSLICGGEPQH